MASSLIKDLIDRVQQLADRVDSAYRTRALNALDEAIQWYAGKAPWDALRRIEDFYASGEFLILPDRVSSVERLGDKTNARHIYAGDRWERRHPGAYFQGTTGAPLEWRDVGFTPLGRSLDTDTTLNFSTDQSESISVQVRGLVFDSESSGSALELYEAQETISMKGVTETASNLYRVVLDIQKDKGTNEDVKIGSDADGLLSRIPAWATRPLFRKLQMIPRPSGQTIEVAYYARPPRIVAEDGPVPGPVNEEAILWRAAGNMFLIDQSAAAAQVAWGKADEHLLDRRRQEENHGERDDHVEPRFSYMELENEYWQD